MYLSGNFNSSRLIRLLGDSTSLDIDASKQDFAEKLSHWLNAGDTVTLHAALQSIKTAPKEKPWEASSAIASEVATEFQRVKTTLMKDIRSTTAYTATEQQTDYAPYHKRHLDQQRQMELKIAPLRAHVRQALSRASPKLMQLATLDAILEKTVSGREQRLLSKVPVFLEGRFKHLQKTQAHALDAFGSEWHAFLLAELDVRLQPVLGLIEAFSNEVKKHP